mmetsp:Transcript_21956/g.62540  ORF Transcript_21956/g.62540 Transcript_21956/m.62540 type:complete len:480 (-) Transcript_21956:417-1856(-)
MHAIHGRHVEGALPAWVQFRVVVEDGLDVCEDAVQTLAVQHVVSRHGLVLRVGIVLVSVLSRDLQRVGVVQLADGGAQPVVGHRGRCRTVRLPSEFDLHAGLPRRERLLAKAHERGLVPTVVVLVEELDVNGPRFAGLVPNLAIQLDGFRKRQDGSATRRAHDCIRRNQEAHVGHLDHAEEDLEEHVEYPAARDALEDAAAHAAGLLLLLFVLGGAETGLAQEELHLRVLEVVRDVRCGPEEHGVADKADRVGTCLALLHHEWRRHALLLRAKDDLELEGFGLAVGRPFLDELLHLAGSLEIDLHDALRLHVGACRGTGRQLSGEQPRSGTEAPSKGQCLFVAEERVQTHLVTADGAAQRLRGAKVRTAHRHVGVDVLVDPFPALLLQAKVQEVVRGLGAETVPDQHHGGVVVAVIQGRNLLDGSRKVLVPRLELGGRHAPVVGGGLEVDVAGVPALIDQRVDDGTEHVRHVIGEHAGR